MAHGSSRLAVRLTLMLRDENAMTHAPTHPTTVMRYSDSAAKSIAFVKP